MQIIRQNCATRECLAATSAGMLLDWPCKTSSLEGLIRHEGDLLAGAVPIGSVEFVREAMRIAKLGEPEPLSYPRPLWGCLGRTIRQGGAAEALGFEGFVKPVRTKLFSGFLHKPGHADISEHEKEQLDALRSLEPGEPVWMAEEVDFAGEWRAYVCDGRLLGMERYDPDGVEGVEAPEVDWVIAAIDSWERSGMAPRGYSLDIGRLSAGGLALVEANDAWALGLYGRSMSDKAYVGMLAARWAQLREQTLAPESRRERSGSKP